MGLTNAEIARFRAEWERLHIGIGRAKPTGSRLPWFRIENAAGDSADVYIYEVVGFDWWTGEGVTAKDFALELSEITAKNIVLHINSPGGDVFDGLAIYNTLKAHPASVTARVEGIAASAASFIAMAGDKVVMASHAMMMIHEASGLVLGNAADMRKEADILDGLSDNIAGIYADHAGGTVSSWRAKMTEETWLTDKQALDEGLADEIDNGTSAPQNRFDLSIYRNAPKDLLPTDPLPDPKATSEEPAEAKDQEPKGWMSAASMLALLDLQEAEMLAVT